ncbi:unnamed protein product [Closterium sp. NIES-53]
MFRRSKTDGNITFLNHAVDPGAEGGGNTGGAESGGAGFGGAESPTRGRWGSPGGGAGGAGARGTAEGNGVGGAGGTGIRGTDTRGATGGTGAGGTGGAGAGGANTRGATGGTGVGGASWQESLSPQQLREWAVRWGIPDGGAGGAGTGGVVTTEAGGSGGVTTQQQPSPVRHLLSLSPTVIEFPVAGTTPPLLFLSPDQSQPKLLPHSPLPAPAPYTAVTESLSETREHASRLVTPVRTRRAARPRPPPVPITQIMALRPSSVPQRVVLPSPPVSSLPHVPDSESNLVRTVSPTITHLLATAVTDPAFSSPAASGLSAELVDFAALCRLDYIASLVFDSACPPSVRGELALGCDVLEDRQFELDFLVAAAPHLASTLICPKGDPDALDIPTLRSYADAITVPYSSQWQIAMDAEMASWKLTGTYVNALPPPGSNIVDGMCIFKVRQPPSSPPAFKARYIARCFSQREGVNFFHTFSPTLKMTTLRALLRVVAWRDYQLHSLKFSTAFLQGSLYKEIWLRRPRGLTGSFPEDTSLSPFYVPVYIHNLVFATADTEALALVKAELQERHTCTDLGELRSYLGLQITRDRAQCSITLTQSHMVQQVLQRLGFQLSSPQPIPLLQATRSQPHLRISPHRKEHWTAAQRVLCYLYGTSGMGLVLGGRGPVVLTDHSDASWDDNQTTHRSTQGYSFSLGTGSVSWRSTRSSSVLSSNCEAEIYPGDMAAQELH